MRILAVISGEYGRRHVKNIRENGPSDWTIEQWQAPATFPLMLDYPEDYIPDTMPPADLILSFGEHKAIAELLPEIAPLTGAKSVMAAIDNEAWLPRGLARQMRGWLKDIGVASVTPKPLCSLTETHYDTARRTRVEYNDPLIAEFARHFGRPELHLTIEPQTREITNVEVLRDAVCGCATFVAEGLVGISVDEAEYKAGMLHHHYPCLASMAKDIDYGDTLMHISGNIIKDNVGVQVKPFKQYLKPGQQSE